MNEYDSSLLADKLSSLGWEKTSKSEEAELIIYNTCSVREKAEQRVRAHIAESSALKRRKKGKTKLAVIGCMAERTGKALLNDYPEIDFVLGPDYLFQLPDLLNNGFKGEGIFTASKDGNVSVLSSFEPKTELSGKGISAFVAISRGCENYCSYCIVPYVRGPLRNRRVDDILSEVRQLVSKGAVEVVLLGQNVNSYEDGRIDFPDLLRMVSSIEGVKRIRFTTSHPKDVSEKLFRIMAETPQICESLHLPLQSGSDRVLTLMNRGYTIGQYKKSMELARRYMPDLCLTTDLIAGFPTETEDDFEMTLKAVESIGFDAAFMFRYSNRPGTAAERIKDNLTDEIRISRLNRLIDLQQSQAKLRNQRLIGKIAEVLIDGISKKDISEPRGKDRGGRTVIIKGANNLKIGEFVKVKIIGAGSWTLIGEVV